MPYIGKQLVRGQNRELDDISGSFNGSNTVFNLTVGGDSITPGSALQLFISIGGVLQNPNTDFTVAGNQITFSTAPGSGLSFFGILQGDAVDFNTPADGSVTTAKLGSNLTINVADGTEGTPSIQFNGSGTDTGFYSPTTDEIGASVAGGEALRIDSSGRLLVGTSTARSTGTVTWLSQIEGGSLTGFGITTNANNTVGAYLSLAKSRGTTIGSSTIVNNNDVLGGIIFSGADGVDANSQAALIKCEVDGTPGANDMPGRLVFSTTADGASSPTERMRITSDAYVRLASGTGGIQFNGDTAAANALDDYEEGAWTPVLSGPTAQTYTSTGRYIKIGNALYIQGQINWTVAPTGGSNYRITLPFSNATDKSIAQQAILVTRQTALNNAASHASILTGASMYFYTQTTALNAAGFYQAGTLGFAGTFDLT